MVSRVPQLVSILTPSFEQARFLRDCLESVSRQTYGSIEHVVMDGGSCDGSAELLVRSARPGLRWRTEPDRGQAHALNKAFAESEGSIIGWINSDDAYVDRRAVAWAVGGVRSAPPDRGWACMRYWCEENTVLHFGGAPPFSRGLFRRVNFVGSIHGVHTPGAIEREGTFLDERYDFVFDRDRCSDSPHGRGSITSARWSRSTATSARARSRARPFRTRRTATTRS
jgi:glycosyltransferase involved in cell wall biosynthesis